MKQLFIVLLGGKHPRASIEVHDIVIATGACLADTHEQLRQHWFGSPQGLHIDAWMQVDGIDGYRLEFSDSLPAAGEPKLFLINLGGYLPEEFGESHRYLPVVARDAAEAKRRGKQQIPQLWAKPHTDAIIDVDDCLPLDYVNGSHIHLTPGPHRPIHFENDYILLD
ncbi:DUF1543 domain-containing protein [Stutzerimonas kirkiae]|uniref:DUF1543 domain-containing protein n=1 Tax=Stutzerimonas kirkiae TaxID=2211392 RepID=A0A4Q9R076_9GAMM|nr:DUF1543 domain-containing protein [Stutzerimonas kirkiae]TBU92017.1 DUF1543 domain-containing protein [Stutzerimonas kirkiae]TBU98443.1 DUF1543 domain-containing protein [Stutzerimonas kirkiae]TBV05578.1 DUF1543 domain-containing protein [Stutzerimonas kirkiae]TBV10682.1 DUF1543 domain-containing protein [Stutzerimonas kirkiae]